MVTHVNLRKRIIRALLDVPGNKGLTVPQLRERTGLSSWRIHATLSSLIISGNVMRHHTGERLEENDLQLTEWYNLR